jgi:DNA-binding MarR family transcriptional regulator
MKLTVRERDLLEYIKEHGGHAVQMSARDVLQNKNFYQRITKLEKYDLIYVVRVLGEASHFSITPKGKQVLKAKPEDPEMTPSKDPLTDHQKKELTRSIKNSNIDVWVQEKILSLLD